MCDKDHFAESVAEYEARGLVTRTQFGVLLGAGVAMLLPGVANAQAVTERDVQIKTPDDTADSYFVHPTAGSAAAVLIWPDIFGLRPAMRNMAKRLAGSGYSVLVVNPFYRVGKPTATGATPIAEMMPFRKGMSAATDMTDAKAFVAWLEAQPQVNKNRKIGTQGTAWAAPWRSVRRQPFPIESAPWHRFMAAGSSATTPAVRICMRPRRKHRSSSPSPRTTTSSDRTTRPC